MQVSRIIHTMACAVWKSQVEKICFHLLVGAEDACINEGGEVNVFKAGPSAGHYCLTRG